MDNGEDWLVENREKIEKVMDFMGQASALMPSTVGQPSKCLRMDNGEDWLVENREKMEKVMDFMGQASEVMPSTVGQPSKCLRMDNVEDWLVENREKMEKVMDFMGQASAVLASTVGQPSKCLRMDNVKDWPVENREKMEKVMDFMGQASAVLPSTVGQPSKCLRMDNGEDWLVKNREKIEKVLDFMGQASGVLASTVGQFSPIMEWVCLVCNEILSNPEGKEADSLTEQFELVNQKLQRIQNQVVQISLELKRSAMNKQNFDSEVQMLSQYDRFKEFINAKPKFKEIRKGKFLRHYENSKGVLYLDGLYNRVMGQNITNAEPMLETVVSIEARSRRAVEDFCVRLKRLFVIGIIATMAYAALKKGMVDEKFVKKWQERMEDVETRMKAAVDDCTDRFPEQAKSDIEHMLQEKTGSLDTHFIDPILEFLVKKYDWISWSVRVFRRKERFPFNLLARKKSHGQGRGENSFEVMAQNKFTVVVSFCVEPVAINRDHILEQIEGQLKGNVMEVAETLSRNIPNCLVHVVSRFKVVVENNNFQPECYYYEKHKKAIFCIHPV